MSPVTLLVLLVHAAHAAGDQCDSLVTVQNVAGDLVLSDCTRSMTLALIQSRMESVEAHAAAAEARITRLEDTFARLNASYAQMQTLMNQLVASNELLTSTMSQQAETILQLLGRRSGGLDTCTVQKFTASGTYSVTFPQNTTLFIECGGGGGGGSSFNQGGSPGGASTVHLESEIILQSNGGGGGFGTGGGQHGVGVVGPVCIQGRGSPGGANGYSNNNSGPGGAGGYCAGYFPYVAHSSLSLTVGGGGAGVNAGVPGFVVIHYCPGR
eukprot:m.70733 g.70733  ORF g.70733 m.70733 type:complete len:269 (-) comp16858_c0_seq3:133-939(-)